MADWTRPELIDLGAAIISVASLIAALTFGLIEQRRANLEARGAAYHSAGVLGFLFAEIERAATLFGPRIAAADSWFHADREVQEFLARALPVRRTLERLQPSLPPDLSIHLTVADAIHALRVLDSIATSVNAASIREWMDMLAIEMLGAARSCDDHARRQHIPHRTRRRRKSIP